MNNVKLVIMGDKGFVVLPFNTTKRDTTMKKTTTKLEIKQTTWMNNNVSGFRGLFTNTKGTPIKKILETKQTA